MMTMILGLIAAVSGAAPADDEMNIPIGYEVVRPADERVPISASVRAATWDELTEQPEQPVYIRLACIVFVPSGAPGNCVPASLVPRGQKTVEWGQILDAAQAQGRSTGSPDDALFRLAERRVGAVRLVPGDASSVFAVRFFEEVIGSADARPPLAVSFEKDLTTRDVAFAKPLDGRLLEALYPPVAMRFSVNARVSMACTIEPTLELLCRDPGVIVSDPAEVPGFTDKLMEDLRFSTYQLASTIKLQPKTADGRDVAGRHFRFVVRWSMPSKQP